MRNIEKMSADSLIYHIEKWESRVRALKATRKFDELSQAEDELQRMREELRDRPHIRIMRDRTDNPYGNRSF